MNKKKSEGIFSLFTSFLTDFESFEIEAVKNLSSATTNKQVKCCATKREQMNNCSDHSLHLSDVYNMLLYCIIVSSLFISMDILFLRQYLTNAFFQT